MSMHLVRRAVSCAAVLAALGAILAGPAHAATSAAATLGCAPGQTVSTAFSAAASSTARGARERAARNLSGSTEIAGPVPGTGPGFSAVVPVHFHVLAKSTRARDGWVSDDQIHRQMDVLNQAFAAAGTGFSFELKGITRTVNAEWHDMATFQDEMEAKAALKVGGATTLNVYSTSVSLGFAYYPSIVTKQQYEVLDGVVIHFDSMPGGKIRNYNLGHTATHEVGHWLGLAHTFEGGCQGHGDHVDDTPAMSVPTSGCPAGKDTCPEPGLDPIHNYMDYSYDACYEEFTAGQVERQQEQYLHWRVRHG